MNPDSITKLRLDRRLQTRRGWIDPAELEKELADLPDVSHKIDDSKEDGDTEAGSSEV